jgi:hypothetical protein
MPRSTIGAMKLGVENILVTLPGLVEHEAILGRRVSMQHRFAEHRFASHRIKDGLQELEKLVAPFRLDVKVDHVGHGHRLFSTVGNIVASMGDLVAHQRPSMTCRVKKRRRGASRLTSEVMALRAL